MKKISKNTTKKSEMNQAGYSHVLSKFLHARNGKHHQEQSRRAALAAAFGHHKGQEASHSQGKSQIQPFSMTAKVSDSNPERLFMNVYDTTAYKCLILKLQHCISRELYPCPRPSARFPHPRHIWMAFRASKWRICGGICRKVLSTTRFTCGAKRSTRERCCPRWRKGQTWSNNWPFQFRC